MNNRFFIFLSLLVFQFLAAPALASSCGYLNLQIKNATPSEAVATCDYINRLKLAFNKMGANADLVGTIIFEDQAVSPVSGSNVHGYFDSEKLEIHMTHLAPGANSTGSAYGLPKTEEIMGTFLLHELAHMYVFAYMGERMGNITSAWHEALAYALQFSLMDSKTRSFILTQNSSATAFEETYLINSFVYGVDPDKFAIRAYLAFKNWGGLKFAKDLMDEKIPGTAFEFVF